MPPKAVSLSTVAKQAGVSTMTVSRVMRNSPRVSKVTRAKVEKAIKNVGYRADPYMARLMSAVRERKHREIQAAIAIVRDEFLSVPYRFVSSEHIRARANQHGYQAEDFVLGHKGMTAERMVKILRARGIEGVIASPSASPKHLSRFDFSGFSSATFGYGLMSPDLHRASTNMTQGILAAIDKLVRRGYQRIGLAVTEWIDQRADHTYSGALLYYQMRTPKKDHVPLLLLPNISISQGANKFTKWMKKYRPDAIISFDQFVPDWIEKNLGLRIPDDVGLVVHDWVPGMEGWAGIDHRRCHVASAAVDLVATQLMHNESGIPDVPKQILIPPEFVDGDSIS